MRHRHVPIALCALACLLASSAAFSENATREGKLAFNTNCRTCHSVEKGDNRLGPSLHGIFGSETGAAEGYGNYSQSLLRADIVWNEETLDRFIADPDKMIPGNNMNPYAGIPDASVRQKIIEYLKSQSEK